MKKKVEQAKMYTQEEVDEIVEKAVSKAIRQDREMLAQVIRGMPNFDAVSKQELIESLTTISTVLSQGFTPTYIVDLDADPMVPDGWTFEEHIKGGQFEFDPKQVIPYLDEEQQDGGVIVGNKLSKKLKGKPVYNANLLDFYLAHPNLIPEEWKGKAVFFWGTIYRDSDGGLCVRCLIWYGGRWSWDCFWLDRDFHGGSPVAVPASN